MFDQPQSVPTLQNFTLVITFARISSLPQLAQRVDLLAPIAKHLQDLASGREHTADDEVVEAIQTWALKNGYLFWQLFGLTIKTSEIDSIGKKQNTAIATVNKILKKLGYRCERTKQLGTGVDRVNVYQVTNSDCVDRLTIHQALENRYQGQLGTTHTFFNDNNPNIKSVCVDTQTQLELDIHPAPDIPPEEIEIDYVSIQNLKIGDRVRYTGNMIAYSNSIGSITGFSGDNYQTSFTTKGRGSVSSDEIELILAFEFAA